ncbi:MAG: hypothetical protein E6K72_06465 [Candidatus Eisenbacteria bacterium]|uniref:Uncharacterized protein n=1 Tax=Eiseniibacteriota bacterium TaxID=2212470 RepID=A0A538SVF1_UNCEI|nr:MAG: hypothetical protein E6K72_06465 [Candidatus Eisenbacteria bacterium]
MKAAESLFEFMPYGAPELLQSRRERLANALLLSSIATVAAFVAIGGLARLIVVPPVVIALPSRQHCRRAGAGRRARRAAGAR